MQSATVWDGVGSEPKFKRGSQSAANKLLETPVKFKN